MLSKKEFLDVVGQYNLDNIGFKRNEYIKKLIPSLERKEIVILKGVRRCGKTTILKQLIQYLIKENNVDKKNIIYVNLDDFNFIPHLSLDLLELMMSMRDKKEKQYIFLDEVQKIPNFESWLKTYYDRGTNTKFIISGSNASLLTKDMGTLLTGRNLTHEIFPLSFKEFKKVKPESELDEYLEFGGFPEVVLETNKEEKLNILRNYVNDIISKDILQRRNIQDQKKLLTFAQYILNNPGIKLSINKLSKQTNLSKDSVAKYIGHMIDAYILIEVNYFSYSVKAKFHQAQSPKYYSLDNGFYRVNTSRNQKGNQTENAVAKKLRREEDNISYWSDGESEVDFIIKNEAINVTVAEEIPQREIKGLNDLKQKKKQIKKLMIINPEKEGKEENVHFVKIEDFLKQ
jgi:uncharacterized protein